MNTAPDSDREVLPGLPTSSPSLILYLFGPLQAWVRGKPLPQLRSRKR